MSYTGHNCTLGVGCQTSKFLVKCCVCSRNWNLFCLVAEDAAVESFINARSQLRAAVFFDDDSLVVFRCPICKNNKNNATVQRQNQNATQQNSSTTSSTDFGQIGNTLNTVQWGPVIDSLLEKQKNELAQVVRHEFEAITLLATVAEEKVVKSIGESRKVIDSISSKLTQLDDVAHTDDERRKRKKPNAVNLMDLNTPSIPTSETATTVSQQHEQRQLQANGNNIESMETDLLPPSGVQIQSDLKPAARSTEFNSHIHVSGLSIDMTVDHIIKHVMSHSSVTDLSLFEVKCLTDVDRVKCDPKYENKFVSFKLSANDDVIKKLSDKKIWPSFVLIRKFSEKHNDKFKIRRNNIRNNNRNGIRRSNDSNVAKTPTSIAPRMRRKTPIGTPRSRPKNVRFDNRQMFMHPSQYMYPTDYMYPSNDMYQYDNIDPYYNQHNSRQRQSDFLVSNNRMRR